MAIADFRSTLKLTVWLRRWLLILVTSFYFLGLEGSLGYSQISTSRLQLIQSQLGLLRYPAQPDEFANATLIGKDQGVLYYLTAAHVVANCKTLESFSNKTTRKDRLCPWQLSPILKGKLADPLRYLWVVDIDHRNDLALLQASNELLSVQSLPRLADFVGTVSASTNDQKYCASLQVSSSPQELKHRLQQTQSSLNAYKILKNSSDAKQHFLRSFLPIEITGLGLTPEFLKGFEETFSRAAIRWSMPAYYEVQPLAQTVSVLISSGDAVREQSSQHLVSCDSLPGSSGGGLFDSKGRLVGIILGAENQYVNALRLNLFLGQTRIQYLKQR